MWTLLLYLPFGCLLVLGIGAAWHYVAMGLYYFCFIALERTNDISGKNGAKLGLKNNLRHVSTHFVSCLFCRCADFRQLLFRIDTLSSYIHM